jgi:exodeoxyribonuclease VII large subunit
LLLFETRTGQKFTNNIQVLVQVIVIYHPTYGIQLDVISIDPNFTLGVIEQQRQETLEWLCREYPQYIQKEVMNTGRKTKAFLCPWSFNE